MGNLPASYLLSKSHLYHVWIDCLIFLQLKFTLSLCFWKKLWFPFSCVIKVCMYENFHNLSTLFQSHVITQYFQGIFSHFRNSLSFFQIPFRCLLLISQTRLAASSLCLHIWFLVSLGKSCICMLGVCNYVRA